MQSIHNGEIWHLSQCLQQEENIVSRIYDQLSRQGYQIKNIISATRSTWHRGSEKAVVSLVDDAWDCAENRSRDTPYLFDADTTVITDNWINTPTVYRVARLPNTFYGIYYYQPADLIWRPDRDYTFAVNRIDFKRMRVLLNLHQQLGIDSGYVNFNCEDRTTVSQSPQQNFLNQLCHAEPAEIKGLQTLASQMPVKNYSIDHDQTYVSSWLNIIVETYSSDNVVSLSEKTFRCLVTPVPWISFAGRYTMARLRSLGFDVLDDIVDHRYDQLIEAHHKMSELVQTGRRCINEFKTQNFKLLQQRCLVAARHNQQLLAEMRNGWSADFDKWLLTQI